jgi:hypothetical protein
MKTLCALAVLVLLTAATSREASADEVSNFLLTDGTNVITFSLPTSPVPDMVDPDPDPGFLPFFRSVVSIDLNGVSEVVFIDFYDDPMDPATGGGLCIIDGSLLEPTCGDADDPPEPYLLNQAGQALYTAPSGPGGALDYSDPTFVTGMFEDVNFCQNYCGFFTSNFTVTITNSSEPTSTPEPPSLSLLAAGLGVLSFCARRRKAADH